MERIILADTDVLSAFSKVDRVPPILSLFKVEQVCVADSVWAEIGYSAKLQRDYALRLQDEHQQGRIRILTPTPEEAVFAQSLAWIRQLEQRDYLRFSERALQSMLGDE